jgi:hypothetical protein
MEWFARATSRNDVVLALCAAGARAADQGPAQCIDGCGICPNAGALSTLGAADFASESRNETRSYEMERRVRRIAAGGAGAVAERMFE